MAKNNLPQELHYKFRLFMKKSTIAPFLIMFAAALWAVDGIFRTKLTYSIPVASIIFFEHLLGFIILSPIFIKNWRWIKKIKFSQWKIFILMTLVSSVLGTILFTEALAKSFVNNDFITPILLQKLQPVFVVLMSAIFLKEKLNFKFILLAICALFGSYLISFGFAPVQLSLQGKELIYVLAVGAAFCWGFGTILSKKALNDIEFPIVTVLRFLMAIPIAFVFAVIMHQTYDFTQIAQADLLRFLIIAGVTGGAGAIFIYYKGLQNTQAKVSTFAELSFPIVSIFIGITALNPYGAPQSITISQISGVAILLTSIILISLNSNKSIEKPVVK